MLKFYNIPNDKAVEGYAFIFIETELGLFSTVSDWGNYGYIWSSPGMEFREFLLRINTDYLFGKLMSGKRDHQIFDAAGTIASIKKAIEERGGEWEHRAEELALIRDGGIAEEEDFESWQSTTHLEEPWLLGVWKNDPQCTQFCARVWPRFKELLEAELAQEKKDAADAEALKMAKPAILEASRAELEAIQRGLCKHCKQKPIAYPGALFCGAGCSARYEAHVDPLCPTGECQGTCSPEAHGG